jgi:hypothetical protein
VLDRHVDQALLRRPLSALPLQQSIEREQVGSKGFEVEGEIFCLEQELWVLFDDLAKEVGDLVTAEDVAGRVEVQ